MRSKILFLAGFVFLFSPIVSQARLVNNNTIIQDYSFEQPIISQSSSNHDHVHVAIPGLMPVGKPSEPVLPYKSLLLLLPPNTTVESVSVSGKDAVELPGYYIVEAGQNNYPTDLKTPVKIETVLPNPKIYQAKQSFPLKIDNYVGVFQKTGYKIAVLNFTPMQFNPAMRKLSYYPNVTVKVNLKPVDKPGVNAKPDIYAPRIRVNEQANAFDREQLRSLISNPADLDSFYTPEVYKQIQNDQAILLAKSQRGVALASGGGSYSTIGPIDTTQSYKYVIIAPAHFVPSLESFRNRKTTDGLPATIVTTEWIYSNYPGNRPSGGSDNQTRIRNFLIDAYNVWGAQFVLLVGDSDHNKTGSETEDPILPARNFIVYSDIMLDLLSDMYYSNLDGTFDPNANGYYGDGVDSEIGGTVDALSELYIGRVSADSVWEVENFVRKSIAYEDSTDPYLKTNYMLGEWLAFGGIAEYANYYMDEIRFGANINGQDTQGFMSNPEKALSADALYDSAVFTWNKGQLVSLLNSGVHLINGLSHGDENSIFKMTQDDIKALTNTKFPIMYSQGCFAASFDNSRSEDLSLVNSYPQDAVAEHFVNDYGGAVAFIGNTRKGWADTGGTDGISQAFHRRFWHDFFAGNITQLGVLNQHSKETLAGAFQGLSYEVYVNLILLGDPALSVHRPNDLVVKFDRQAITEYSGNHDPFIDVGETAAIVIDLRAFNQDAQNISASLSTTDTNATVIQGVANYGNILKGEVKNNSATPFTVKIANNCPWGRTIAFKLTITGSNGFSKVIDNEISLYVNDMGQLVNTGDAYYPQNLAISGNKLAWDDHREGWGYDGIYLYDLTQKIETKIDAANSYGYMPRLSGDKIVWNNYVLGTSEVKLYDLTLHALSTLTPSGIAGSNPRVSSNKVVWGQSDGIYLYDIDLSTTTKLVSETELVSPDISGNRVVWADRRSGQWDVYVYDLLLHTETKLTNTEGTVRNVIISGNTVVWVDVRATDPANTSSIYMYDLLTNTGKAITTNTNYKLYPGVSGNLVVWTEQINSANQIFLYDISKKYFIQLTQSGYHENLALDGNNIVWTDIRTGNWNMYLYNINSETAVSAPSILTYTFAAWGARLQWTDNSKNETCFLVERSTDGVNYTQIATLNKNTVEYLDMIFPSTVPGTKYYYRVRAANAKYASVYTNVVTVTVPTSPPRAPSNLVVQVVTPYRVELTWTDNASNETGYSIDKYSNSNNFISGFSSAANMTAYTDTKVVPGAKYYYKVYCRNLYGPSGSISSITVTIPNILIPPSNLNLTLSSANTINLAWSDNSNNETNFIVQRSTDGTNFTALATLPANSSAYSDTTANPEVMYYYRIAASYGVAAFEYSPTIIYHVLSEPTNLTAQADLPSNVNLTWSENSAKESSVIVQRSFDGVNFSNIATLPPNTVSYTDTSASIGGTNYYRLYVANNYGRSVNSSIVNVNLISAPTNLQAVASLSNTVNLSWTDASSNEDSFIIERSTDGVNYAVLGTVTANTSSYDDHSASPETTYHYRVFAKNGENSSLASNVADVTTPSNLVSIGNFVYKDNDQDWIFNPAVDEVISGVPLELWIDKNGDGIFDPAGADAQTPIQTTSNAQGRYYFDRLTPGSYFVHIPAAVFELGHPLANLASNIGSSSNLANDETVDEKGVDDKDFKLNGITSSVIQAQEGQGPLGENSTDYTGTVPDASTYFTVDFGFYLPKPTISRIGDVYGKYENNLAVFSFTKLAGTTDVLGFAVERKTAKGWLSVSKMLPVDPRKPTAIYKITEKGLKPGVDYQYRIISFLNTGRREIKGPFVINYSIGGQEAQKKSDK